MSGFEHSWTIVVPLSEITTEASVLGVGLGTYDYRPMSGKTSFNGHKYACYSATSCQCRLPSARNIYSAGL